MNSKRDNRLIVARVANGLGNQLFIYAAARRIAHERNARLMVDCISSYAKEKYGAIYQLGHFAISAPLAPPNLCFATLFGRRKREFLNSLSDKLPLHLKTYVKERDFQNGVAENNFSRQSLRRVVRLEGYWQAERYFRPIEEIIRREFTIVSPLSPESKRIMDEISSVNAVAVHVRQRRNARHDPDAPVPPEVPQLPFSYYERALEFVAARVNNPVFFCFGDDPLWLERQRTLPYFFRYVAHNRAQERAFEDIALMKQCNNFIVSNSTFGWWGAWLSDNATKLVVAPANKPPFTWASERDVIPSHWNVFEPSISK